MQKGAQTVSCAMVKGALEKRGAKIIKSGESPNMRKILVGQQPGKKNPPNKPLWGEHSGSTGYRLAMMSGLDIEAYHDIYHRVNINHLNDVTFGVNEKTKYNGLRIRATFQPDDLIIALGKDVCECLCLPVPGHYFQFKKTDKGFMYAVIPHPSGLNRFYNDQENWLDACDFMRAVVAHPGEYDPDEHPWNKPEDDGED